VRSYRIIIVFLMASAGCVSNQQPATDVTNAQQAQSAAGPIQTLDTPAAPATLSGRLLERLDASNYSYLRIASSEGEIWAAVPQTTIETGADVTIENPMPMVGFESKSLNRKFDQIYFGTLAEDKGPALQPLAAHGGGEAVSKDEMETMRLQHGGVAANISSEPIKVDKAPGADGKTVAEIFEQRSQLVNQRIAVRGKVVKISMNIMGKNWIHLRDGTGRRESNTDDITVTTQETASVGDIVLIKGKISTDRDFGMGYSYPVMIEDAQLIK
jgi:hypothetical protein